MTIKMESYQILLVFALIGIASLILLFQNTATGQSYYRTPHEACATYMNMCGDNLPPLFTGNIDMGANVVECVCQTNPYKVGWRSLYVEYGRVGYNG